MKRFFHLVLVTACLAMVVGCHSIAVDYEDSIRQWQKERLANLIKEDGWATLAGLFPLREGKQYFGSGRDNQLVFPDFAPDTMGYFGVMGDSVWMEIRAGIGVQIDDLRVTQALLAPNENLLVCTLGRLQWFIIKRGDRFMVRVRDIEHPARQSLTLIPCYPTDRKWCLEASFHTFDSIKIVPLPNALDMMVENESPGYLEFEFEGKSYEIVTLEEGPELFLLFYDQTSGSETYGGGRYMYVDKPGIGEKVTLDFNKAYSPPCAFTEYATCLLPPPENRFPFAITAGEKDPHFLAH
ncbi:MAG: DUF1684 domain-containing protein [Saprospiraceae bacterium]|nr:DUF1684 domain-containing protein [Saprospiraceae bacterium]